MRLSERRVSEFADATLTTAPIEVAVVPRGMRSGRPALVFLIELPDGTLVAARTTMRLFLQMADALRERYPTEVH